MRRPLFVFLGSLTAALACAVCARAQQPPPRRILADISSTSGPVDRFFDLSVGSDYPGTLIRDDSQAQLKLAVDELGFRYIRFHAIFHDVLGTVKVENGKTVYDWTKIDQLYDDLLARHVGRLLSSALRPRRLPRHRTAFSIGMATHRTPSRRVGMIWSMLSFAILKSATGETRCAAGTSKSGTSRTFPASGKARTRMHTLLCTT
jgi:xylan 1,4-beta-xylosidase